MNSVMLVFHFMISGLLFDFGYGIELLTPTNTFLNVSSCDERAKWKTREYRCTFHRSSRRSEECETFARGVDGQLQSNLLVKYDIHTMS